MTYWKTEETSSNRPLFEALRPTLKKVGSREENSIHLPQINVHLHPCPNLDFAHTTLTTSWRRAVKELPLIAVLFSYTNSTLIPTKYTSQHVVRMGHPDPQIWSQSLEKFSLEE